MCEKSIFQSLKIERRGKRADAKMEEEEEIAIAKAGNLTGPSLGPSYTTGQIGAL